MHLGHEAHGRCELVDHIVRGLLRGPEVLGHGSGRFFDPLLGGEGVGVADVDRVDVDQDVLFRADVDEVVVAVTAHQLQGDAGLGDGAVSRSKRGHVSHSVLPSS